MLKIESPRKLVNVYCIDSHILSDTPEYIYKLENFFNLAGVNHCPWKDARPHMPNPSRSPLQSLSPPLYDVRACVSQSSLKIF